MNKLEPCPFCGYTPDIDSYDFCYPAVRDKTVWQAGCEICDSYTLGWSKNEAIKKWNKRHETISTNK